MSVALPDWPAWLRLATPAWLCVVSAATLTGIGVLAIDVSGGPRSDPQAQGLDARATNQLVTASVSLVLCAIAAVPHSALIRRVAWPALAILTVSLVFLLIPFVPTWLVRPQNGARSWVTLGPINIQPSELTKIAYVMTLAVFFRHRESHRRWSGLLAPALLTLVPMGLITLQPDLGTASLFAPTLLAMVVAAGARRRHVLSVIVLAALAAPLSYPFLQPHQRARIDGLAMLIRGDASGHDDINFQQLTAQRIAGAGQWTGVEDARSRALIRHNALPEPQTDMIFAVVVNRWGARAGVLVLALYAMWVGGCAATACATRDPTGRLIAVGFMAMVGVQTLVNVAMTLGLAPIIGITLPFMSYGRSSLVASWLMTGLVLGVGLRREVVPVRASFEFAEDHDA